MTSLEVEFCGVKMRTPVGVAALPQVDLGGERGYNVALDRFFE